jgi:hypothetical protein
VPDVIEATNVIPRLHLEIAEPKFLYSRKNSKVIKRTVANCARTTVAYIILQAGAFSYAALASAPKLMVSIRGLLKTSLSVTVSYFFIHIFKISIAQKI